MSQKAVKIFEISGASWMGGISVHPYMPIGGLFKSATNFDPFERVGVYVPTRTGSRIGTSEITVNIKFLIPFNGTNPAVPHVYGFGNATVYDINTNTLAVKDQSDEIKDFATARGVIKYKGAIVYASDNNVRAGSIPLSSLSVTGILSLTTAGHFMHIAPDRNLYITNLNNIARITSVTDKTLNTAAYLAFESDVITRGLDDDGKHLIIVGDTNSLSPTTAGKFRCFVGFWNMKSQDLTRMWEFEDNTIYGVASVEDEVIVFGADNIYTCSVDSRPKVLISMRGNSAFATAVVDPGTIVKRNNSIVLWGGTGGTSLRGYGRLHPSMPKALFTGYSAPAGNINAATIVGSGGVGDIVWISTDGARLYNFPSDSNRDVSTIVFPDIDFKGRYRFAFAKMILAKALASGQNVSLSIYGGEGNEFIFDDSDDGSTGDQAFSFTTVGAKYSHIFWPSPNSSNPTVSSEIFENFSLMQIVNTKAHIRRFEVWAYPLDPAETTGF